MQELSAAWLYPIILIGGALQAWGPPMNGALRNSLTNPWLASLAEPTRQAKRDHASIVETRSMTRKSSQPALRIKQ